MLYKDICKILVYYFLGLMVTLSIPFFLAIHYQFFSDPASHPQPHTTMDFFWSMLVCLGLALICRYLGRNATGHLYRREGLVTVVLIWFITPAIAAMPFYTSGTLKDPFHAFFETTSGFTTTGATTMQAKKFNEKTGDEVPIEKTFCGSPTTVYSYWGTIDPVRDPKTGKVLYEGIEAVSKALLFWRSFTQWLGGMGIVLLFIAILPVLGVGGKVSVPGGGPRSHKRFSDPSNKGDSAAVMENLCGNFRSRRFFFLMSTNSELDWFEATTIMFSTMSTGGFTVKNASVGAFNNPYTDWVVIIFMVISGVNFSLYYYAIKGKFYVSMNPNFSCI